LRKVKFKDTREENAKKTPNKRSRISEHDDGEELQWWWCTRLEDQDDDIVTLCVFFLQLDYNLTMAMYTNRKTYLHLLPKYAGQLLNLQDFGKTGLSGFDH